MPGAPQPYSGLSARSALLHSALPGAPLMLRPPRFPSFFTAISVLYRLMSRLRGQFATNFFSLGYNTGASLRPSWPQAGLRAQGVRVSVSDIVSCGKLSQYLLSTYTARKLGMRSNGHCGGIYNWFVTNNTFDGLSSLLKMMGKGIFVTSLMGEGASVIDGNFSRGAFGFWVEDGEIRYPVHEFTVAGNMKDVFSNMVAMANDYDPRLGIQSGSVLIDDIAVAGI